MLYWNTNHVDERGSQRRGSVEGKQGECASAAAPLYWRCCRSLGGGSSTAWTFVDASTLGANRWGNGDEGGLGVQPLGRKLWKWRCGMYKSRERE